SHSDEPGNSGSSFSPTSNCEAMRLSHQPTRAARAVLLRDSDCVIGFPQKQVKDMLMERLVTELSKSSTVSISAESMSSEPLRFSAGSRLELETRFELPPEVRMGATLEVALRTSEP